MYPLISIVIPIYKVEKYIHKCINSVINQTYKNLEIILVNDGSPDNCGRICDEYASKDSRIKVIHKKNGGLSDARNFGIDIATGEYIGFVDSDDYIDLDMYEYLYNLIIKNKADIAICGIYTKYQDKIVVNNISEDKIVMDSKDAIKEMLKEKYFNTSAWDKLYKRELFKDIRYPYGKLSEDLFTTYKLFDKSNKVVFGSQAKYYYVQTPNSIMRSIFNEKKLDTLEGLEEIIKFTEFKYPELTQIALNRYTRYNIAYIRQIIQCNYENNDIVNNLIKNIKQNIKQYFKSEYKFSSKIFGLLVSTNYNLTKTIFRKAL